MEKLIMIKYGELSTKKDNIKVFIEKLHNNIKRKLKDYDITITKNKVRMFIDIKDNDETIIIKKLKEVFGIHSIVICYKVNGDIESIKNESYNLLNKEKFNTFKVETNRADKNFPYNSMEISKLVGAHILKNIQNIKVDVHNPDIILHVEVRSECSYIYTKEIYGLGGYPTGIQGKGLLMLSGGIDSPVAGFLANKRGVDIDAIYYESPPHTSIDAKNKVISLAKELHKYGSNINLYVMPFDSEDNNILYNITPYVKTQMVTEISDEALKILHDYGVCRIVDNAIFFKKDMEIIKEQGKAGMALLKPLFIDENGLHVEIIGIPTTVTEYNHETMNGLLVLPELNSINDNYFKATEEQKQFVIKKK